MKTQRLSKRHAEALVRRCLEQGEVIRSWHFINELANEDLTFADVLPVLRAGTIYDEPEPDIRTGEWKYRMEGYELGGKYVVIVFSFKSTETTLLITIFSIVSRRRSKP